MADLIQDVRWPGVVGVESLTGTISHGISPGTFVLTTYPQTARPFLFGNLVFGDGQRAVTLRRCKVDRITGTRGPAGQTWELEILDRRWRWRNATASLGAIFGRYNRQDSRGKLVPWTIRSPHELATLCLQALGETNFAIDLPQGLTASAGRDLDRYLRTGENFPQSLANPEQFWDVTPPAEALSRLCDYFGRRVIYQPIRDRVVIAPLGVGAGLPDGPYEVQTPAIDVPELPSAVTVAGAPIRFDTEFLIEPVGEDWDGMYVPIDQLSYAPRGNGQAQIVKVVFTGEEPPAGLELTFTWVKSGGPRTASARDTDPAHTTIAARWAELVSQIANNAELSQLVTASANGSTLVLTGQQAGQTFTVVASQPLGGDPAYRTELVQEANAGGASWATSHPPSFSGVRPTDRLSHAEALNLARRSVWRCFRIVMPIVVPGYGPVARRQQIVLQPTQVKQVVPLPRIPGGQDKGLPLPPGQLGQGILPEYYNGYSRDRAAVVYGSVRWDVGTVTWNPTAINFPNTSPTDRVRVPFRIDPVEQLVIFDDYVYALEVSTNGFLRIRVPSLVLETACLVADPVTDQLVRYVRSLPLGGDAPAEWLVRDDLQVGVIGHYNVGHQLTGYSFLDQADTDRRAAYYLDGMARKYRLTGAETRQYIGIWPIELDGSIQQVSWSIGQRGPTTIASKNTEHSPVIPPYPARRKAEALAPNQAAAAANMAERAAVERLLPQPGGNVR